MVVVVSPAEPRDVEEIAALIEEMNRFYGVTEFAPLEQRAAQIREDLFSAPSAAFALLAWENAQLVGMASYSFLWPAVDITRSLYLKELYVSQNHRRAGIGSLLMDQLPVVATRQQCSRVEWTADTANEAAQAFYRRLGYVHEASKLFYRVSL